MKWVKCSDRLPEKEETVILFIDGGIYVGYLKIEPAYITGRKHIVHHNEVKYFHTYEYDNCCNGHNPKFEDVTHWMPLPDLPKDE